jgi:dCMP deaminase
MTCPNCSIKPGGVIPVDEKGNCESCGEPVTHPADRHTTKPWDDYFITICHAVASKSHCLSRQVGAVIVRDNSVVSTGYNGPARGYPHCEGFICPRHVKGCKSGEGLHECPAGHAESNAIANAARLGVNISGATLYLNCLIPCKDCMILIVNAGISMVVPEIYEPYHKMSVAIAEHGNVTIRRIDK